MGFVLIPPDLPNLPVAPSPLPASEPEKTHHLSNGSQRGESEVKTLPPDLAWGQFDIVNSSDICRPTGRFFVGLGKRF
jgi:hypothetical protein